jgi:hypothetical protein
MKTSSLFISAALAIYGFINFIYILVNHQCTNRHIILLLGSIIAAATFLLLSNLKKKTRRKKHEKNKTSFYNGKTQQPRYKPAIIKYN